MQICQYIREAPPAKSAERGFDADGRTGRLEGRRHLNVHLVGVCLLGLLEPYMQRGVHVGTDAFEPTDKSCSVDRVVQRKAGDLVCYDRDPEDALEHLADVVADDDAQLLPEHLRVIREWLVAHGDTSLGVLSPGISGVGPSLLL